MNNDIEFIPGQKYTNRKGTFTVLEAGPTTMRVRFDDGVEETLDVAIQRRIIANMALPPRVPEPPPRRKVTAPTRAQAKPAPAPRATRPGPAEAPAPRPARGEPSGDTGPTARPRKAAPAHIPSTTLQQLLVMTERDQQPARLELLRAVLASPAACLAFFQNSRAAEPGPFQAFTVAHINRLNSNSPVPTTQEPTQLLSYAISQNRAYLAAEGQEILSYRFPLYETGMERYIVDLLCYEETTHRAMLVCTRVKTTGRHWLWESLLDSLATWIAVDHTPNFGEALEDRPLDRPPLIAIVAPAAFWADNAPGAGAHVPEVAAGHDLNRRVLTAVESWLNIPVLLLQVPDAWLRTVEELDHPHVSPAPFPRS